MREGHADQVLTMCQATSQMLYIPAIQSEVHTPAASQSPGSSLEMQKSWTLTQTY